MSNTEEDSSHDNVPDLPSGVSEDSLYETFIDSRSHVLVPKHFESFEQYLVVELLREKREDELAKRESYERQTKTLLDNVAGPLTHLITTLISPPTIHVSPIQHTPSEERRSPLN